MPAKKSTSPKSEITQSAKPSEKRYWLFKSEESCYSIDHLAAESNKTTFWDGIRNYQARNMLRDDVQKGDLVFFYHSNTDPLAIAGTARVVKAGYADHTAFDPVEKHYDPKSNPDVPTWYMVDIKFVKKFPKPVTRAVLKEDPVTAKMLVLARGSRLSVQPVTPEEWEAVHRLADVNAN